MPCVHTAELRASTDDRLLRNLFPCSSGNVQTAVRTHVRWTGSDSEQIKCVYSCGNKAAHVMAKLNVFYWPINHCGQTFAQGYKKAKKQILRYRKDRRTGVHRAPGGQLWREKSQRECL